MATEDVSGRFDDLDLWPTETVIRTLADDQALAADAVASQLDVLARAADEAAERLRQGSGRLIYVGAGASGRLAAQDGVELAPTYDWPEARLLILMAGGERAMLASVEGAEDDATAGAAEIARAGVGGRDVVIAVAASGRTPFTVAALRAAGQSGALTIAVANNAKTPLLAAARHPILLDTGAEVVAGSTRMKAGSAQKIALNVLSTAIMVRLGGVYRAQMVAMRASNAKLRARAVRMVAHLANVEPAAAANALAQGKGRIKPAVLIALGVGPEEAETRLASAGNNLRAALARGESHGRP
jgi:N-acetylmuramic acid 6-phosphate etherase